MEKKEKKQKKQYLIVSEKGVIGSGIKNPDDVLAMLLFGYLSVWNEDKFKIDIFEAGKKIVDLMMSLEQDDEPDLEDLLEMLFEEDNEDDD